MSEAVLLFDENISESVPAALTDAFPNSRHVRHELHSGVSDEHVWEFARKSRLILVTRDGDFERMSSVRGAPPKVVWIAQHNPTSAEISNLLRGKSDVIAAFAADPNASLLVLR